jgi:hypothetical protein
MYLVLVLQVRYVESFHTSSPHSSFSESSTPSEERFMKSPGEENLSDEGHHSETSSRDWDVGKDEDDREKNETGRNDDDKDFWLVFHAEGKSLHDLLYEPLRPGFQDEVMYSSTPPCIISAVGIIHGKPCVKGMIYI